MSTYSTDKLDHEKLHVYQASIQLIAWLDGIMSSIAMKHSVRDQLDRVSTSIALNIAEGNGRYTVKDRCRFFDNARGSALECAAALDILSAKKLLDDTTAAEGKRQIRSIIAMLVGLIRNNSEYRLHEERGSYHAGERV